MLIFPAITVMANVIIMSGSVFPAMKSVFIRRRYSTKPMNQIISFSMLNFDFDESVFTTKKSAS